MITIMSFETESAAKAYHYMLADSDIPSRIVNIDGTWRVRINRNVEWAWHAMLKDNGHNVTHLGDIQQFAY